MTEQQIHETKEKIIATARHLFAQKGFEGASIREIATDAGVNIAAINYHFQSKENLFYQVIEEVFSETATNIFLHRKHHPKEKVADLSVWIFDYFLDRSDVLRSVFKMMLSDMGWGPEKQCFRPEEKFGPPGGNVIAEAIEAELKSNVSEPDMFWAVKTIFSTVVHMALMYTNHFCKLPKDEFPYHDRKTLEADIRRLSKVVLKELKS